MADHDTEQTDHGEAEMRLTPELINSSLQFLNPLSEWTLEVRGRKIQVLENLGAATSFECIDLIDNEIQYLSGFPLLPKLSHLLLQRNRISRIDALIAQSTPAMADIQMGHNQLVELADLEPLGTLPKLEFLALSGNPVTQKDNYKFFVLWLCPAVRFLDSQKIRKVEREKAQELFGTKEAPTTLAQNILKNKSKHFAIPGASGAGNASGSAVGGVTDKISRVNLTPEERTRVQEMIKNADSMAEIAQIEQELQNGRVPGGIRPE